MLNRSYVLCASILACVLLLAAANTSEQASAADFQVLVTFYGSQPSGKLPANGEFPETGLVSDGAGTLYGTTFGALGGSALGKTCSKNCGTAFSYSESSGKLNTIYSFEAGKNGDGAFPTGQPFYWNANIYGTTEYGGGTACGGLGCGTAFILLPGSDSDGKPYKFCTMSYPDCTNGAFPFAGPIVDSSGNIYGTTLLGGDGNGRLCNSTFEGCGVIYMLTYTPASKRPWNENVLYSFCANQTTACKDGAVPAGKLLSDEQGNLFGTTEFGGTNSVRTIPQGTIFELQPAGKSYTLVTLYSFCMDATCSDGSTPEAGLIKDANGNFFGTTTYGGDPTCDCGVLFELKSDGNGQYTYMVLYTFKGGFKGSSDGSYPQNALVEDSAGDLFGTTLRGGTFSGSTCLNPAGCGTVFELSAGGTESVLYAFGHEQRDHDGAQPEGELLPQSDGYLYGVTRTGGQKACYCGTLYKVAMPSMISAGTKPTLGLRMR